MTSPWAGTVSYVLGEFKTGTIVRGPSSAKDIKALNANRLMSPGVGARVEGGRFAPILENGK